MKRKREIHIRFTSSSPSKANEWWLGCCTLFAVATERKISHPDILFYPRRAQARSWRCVRARLRTSEDPVVWWILVNLLWEDSVLECMSSLNTLSPAGLLKIIFLCWHSQYVKLKNTKVHYKEMKRYCEILSHCSFKSVPLQNDNKNKEDQRLY